MKFKGIELKDNTEAELLIAIEIVNISDEDKLDEYSEELEETLYDEVFDYDNCDVYTEFLDDNLLNVRCDDITFDEMISWKSSIHLDAVVHGCRAKAQHSGTKNM